MEIHPKLVFDLVAGALFIAFILLMLFGSELPDVILGLPKSVRKPVSTCIMRLSIGLNFLEFVCLVIILRINTLNRFCKSRKKRA